MSAKEAAPELPQAKLARELTTRLAHADENTIVRHAPNGDQNPITVWHSELDPVLFKIEPFRSGPEWAPLRTERMKADDSISHQYSGLWMRALRDALVKGGG